MSVRGRSARTGRRLGRRQFLTSSATAGLLLAAGACGGSSAAPTSSVRPGGSSTVTGVDGRWRLRRAGADLLLPDGFEYTVLQSSADGGMPPAPDGMAAFASTDGTVRLVRNHERGDAAGTASPLATAVAYDPGAAGGTTTVVLGPGLRTVERSYVSLSGTVQNCAGGVTPAGTWLSCEETNEGGEQGRAMSHGYVFEVDPAAEAAALPVPLRAMGRFLHEAVAVDPTTGTVYLTEDNGYDSGLYRFTPVVPGRLVDGGTLEALAVVDEPGLDTAVGQEVGRRSAVTWVPIADPDPASAGIDSSAVFNQGFAEGAARFKRAEGSCLVGSTWYVSATEGGDAGLGQVFAYDLTTSELRLVVEPGHPDELFGPDGLAPTPAGGGVVVAEDNGNGEANRLLVMATDGRLRTFAENIADTTEFSGWCSSPDGSTVFVNVYGDEAAGVPGRTLAIWGPWASLI